ncbi:hypothetical protein D3C78_1050860 [compost metagenome]
MREFRALGFMHGHGVHGFDIIQATGQDKPHAALAIIAWECHAQNLFSVAFLFRELEGNADIAVHQTQPVIVAGHQHRATFVPLLVAVDQARPEQRLRHPLVQALDTPRPLAHGT